MGSLTYNCPHCDEDLSGGFGDDVYCIQCNITFETDWDYVSEGNIGCWLTGKEYQGKSKN